MKTDAHLSPAETARRLGVSAKALRLYERHGLVRPLRSETGWRAYGPQQIARLHQVLALKGLGLPLARIAELLSGVAASLDGLLALQEEALMREQARAGRALALIGAARAKLKRGETLSVDDLTTLATETTMTTKASPEELKTLLDPLIAKHYRPEDLEKLKARRQQFDQADIGRQWDGLFAEARRLMAIGDPDSPASVDLARRWMALADQFTGGDTALGGRVTRVWQDAVDDPKMAGKLPFDRPLFDFMGKAIAAMRAGGG